MKTRPVSVEAAASAGRSQCTDPLKLAAGVLIEYADMIEEGEVHRSGPLKGRCAPAIEEEVAEYRRLAAALTAHSVASGWRPMWELPQVTERTEMVFRKEWTGRDKKVRAAHEVLLVWPDGVLTDSTETIVAPEEMPTHWMPLPGAPERKSDQSSAATPREGSPSK